MAPSIAGLHHTRVKTLTEYYSNFFSSILYNGNLYKIYDFDSGTYINICGSIATAPMQFVIQKLAEIGATITPEPCVGDTYKTESLAVFIINDNEPNFINPVFIGLEDSYG